MALQDALRASAAAFGSPTSPHALPPEAVERPRRATCSSSLLARLDALSMPANSPPLRWPIPAAFAIARHVQ
jgi:hypothetical protein